MKRIETSGAHPVGRRAPLSALFLISLGTVGFEIALTRYFAVAKWSEYGYWVISIVLAGFALSGVVLALARDWFARRAAVLMAILPPLLVLTAAGGYWVATINPFNPLQLQNSATLFTQLANIAGYYAALLPFFTLAGLFISLCFLSDPDRLGRVYGVDLTGAGFGALATLLLMFAVEPFRLVACLLVPLAFAGALVRPRASLLAASLIALAAGETLLLGFDQATVNDFKAIYAPLNVPDSRTVAEVRRPSGFYKILDDFTEHVDTDVSNNAALLGLPGPPSALGVYRDGNRIGGLPKGDVDVAYAPATLAALPYSLLSHPRVLLGGTSGGFRLAEAAALGASTVVASEPEPVLRAAVVDGVGHVPAATLPPGTSVTADAPLALAHSKARFDLIDLSSDFLDSSPANVGNTSVEAIERYLTSVATDGLISIPVSIREFPAYATRMLGTVRAALMAAGVAHPEQHVLAYRSAWNLRILVSPLPFSPERVAAAKDWCEARSFDLSYYPGIDVAAARANIFNDLPDVSFDTAEVTSGEGAHDAVADEAGDMLQGHQPQSARTFDLEPVTLDRPTLDAVLRLSNLPTILSRLEILPQGEVAPLVNVAVLAQAVVIALLVLAVPLVGRARVGQGADLRRSAIYFSALGLGFLMIEIAAIEAASQLLGDRTLAFAVVLTAMLIFSGLGSMLASRVRPQRGLLVSALVIILWCAVLLLVLPRGLLALLQMSILARIALVIVVMAPVSLALGLPFPLGLGRLGSGSGAVPWAWALNGAFSVVATPLANLIAIEDGHARLLQGAVLLYGLALISFPRTRRTQWPDPTSHVAA